MGPSQFIQCIIPTKIFPKDCSQESYISAEGILQELPPRATSYLPVELHIESLIVLSSAHSDFVSICPLGSGADTKLQQRHVYLRQSKMVYITQCRAGLIKALRDHFESTQCVEIIPPFFTGVECEGGATLFKVEHPGKSTDKPMTAYLTQSSQFALEMCIPAYAQTYCIGPSFRAEHSHTRRHLTEFLHAESEWSGIVKFSDHIHKLQSLLVGTLTRFIDICKPQLIALKMLEHVETQLELSKDIVILTHREAIDKCRELCIYKDYETKEQFGDRDDIPEMQERTLIDHIGKIVFLCKFPKEFKSFYMGLDPEDPSLVLGCDVEVPSVGEIIGSGVREHDYDRLHSRLLESGLVPDDYREYLDLRKFGFGMTSGMGLGVDRMLTWLLKEQSIRDVVTFPRFPGYLRP